MEAVEEAVEAPAEAAAAAAVAGVAEADTFRITPETTRIFHSDPEDPVDPAVPEDPVDPEVLVDPEADKDQTSLLKNEHDYPLEMQLHPLSVSHPLT